MNPLEQIVELGRAHREAQQTTIKLLEEIAERKVEFVKWIGELERRIVVLEEKINGVWYAPGMPGCLEAEADWAHKASSPNE